MFQVIHPPYKKVTLACIACLCFEIGVCPWPDLSALFQYTSPIPVVSLHLIPRIQYHQGIPVTLLTGSSYIKMEGCCSFKLLIGGVCGYNTRDRMRETEIFLYFHAPRISPVMSRLSNLPVLKMRSTLFCAERTYVGPSVVYGFKR